MNKKKDKKLKGSVLVYMLFLLVTMSAIGLGIMFSAVSNLKNSIVSTNTDNAMSATENGVQMFFFRAKNGFVNNNKPTVTLGNILDDRANNVFCGINTEGVVDVNVGGAETAWNERLRFKLEFQKDNPDYPDIDPNNPYVKVDDCDEPVINIRHLKSTGYYNNTVRSITMPVSFDFYEKGLIGNWKLDDAIGSSEAVNSADGEVSDGKLSSSGVEFASENIEGIDRSVLEFKGGYVKIEDFDNEPEAITLSAWVKSGMSQTADIISIENDVRMRIRPAIVDPNKYMIRGFYNNDNVEDMVATSDNKLIADNKWHHIVYTVNPAESRQRIYLDGELLKESTSYANPIIYSGEFIYLGTDKTTTQIFTGKMRNVRIYDRELLIPEVKMLYNATWNQ